MVVGKQCRLPQNKRPLGHPNHRNILPPIPRPARCQYVDCRVAGEKVSTIFQKKLISRIIQIEWALYEIKRKYDIEKYHTLL